MLNNLSRRPLTLKHRLVTTAVTTPIRNVYYKPSSELYENQLVCSSSKANELPTTMTFTINGCGWID